ncbi:peptide/nickel transport system permease protein [Nocardia tenerifensis]|uniref:Peptide/nickel transport system permease protein n=1 Tax=Nocardia tenerifensis TaxID=228006 RepID=A0A318JYU8_9NOCA|nr:ABC transporter permease [Nocardia tenerifensis]PXX63912.1 peptide/nickel transport system permease protein [Nocardia tenerifensis]
MSDEEPRDIPVVVPVPSSTPEHPIGMPSAAGVVEVSVRSVRREYVHHLVRSKTFLVGAVLLLWWVGCAVCGTVFSPYDPVEGDLAVFNAAPSGAHWFGTDSLGRDVLSRVITGARDVLIVAPLASLLGTAVGTCVGLVQGYFGGMTDNVIGRVVEAVLALPVVIVALLFVVALGPSAPTLIVVIGIVFGLVVSRTVRTAVLQEGGLDYVAVARLRGERDSHIMFVEILPNVLGPILVEFTVRLGYAIFAVATLSFLGFGIQPPTPDWGGDVASSYQYLAAGYWWETLFPVLAIASLVVAINLVADAVEGVLIQ